MAPTIQSLHLRNGDDIDRGKKKKKKIGKGFRVGFKRAGVVTRLE